MKTIRRNERIGHDIEKLVNIRVKGTLNPKRRSEYDIETDQNLYEVKGAKRRTIDHKPLTREGRFFINLNSHGRLLSTAKEKNKIPLYIFCVYVIENEKPKIKSIKTMHWVEVDQILKERPTFTRQGNVHYSLIPLTMIFGGERIINV